MRLPNGYGSVVKLTGKRRRPYIVRKTKGWHYSEEKEKMIQDYTLIGYAATRSEGLQMLAEYNRNPFDPAYAKCTFKEVYDKWSESKFMTISKSNVSAYSASFKLCKEIYDKPFAQLKLVDLQSIIDTCGKNYPTLRKVKVLFNQLYDFAIKNDLCNKDYSEYVDILKFKNKNPNAYDRKKFTRAEVDLIWKQKSNIYVQIVLMLIYTGVRVSELLDLKKENVHLEEQYFDVIASKTENGIRQVPIADKVLPFFTYWYNDGNCEYLVHTETDEHFLYRNYYDSYFVPIMEDLALTQTPHCCRHTCISMLAEAHVDQTIIKKIVGHSGAMSLTERVYTHFDVSELVKAINLI